MTTGDTYTVVVTAGGTPVLAGHWYWLFRAQYAAQVSAQPGTYRVTLLATSATAELKSLP